MKILTPERRAIQRAYAKGRKQATIFMIIGMMLILLLSWFQLWTRRGDWREGYSVAEKHYKEMIKIERTKADIDCDIKMIKSYLK